LGFAEGDLRIDAGTGISIPLVRALLMDVLLLVARLRIRARLLLGLWIGFLLLLLSLIVLFLV
jgi:hypothetical protein